MHTRHTAITRLASPLALSLALALVAPACTLKITDFGESISTSAPGEGDDTTTDDGVDSESSTSVNGSTSAEGSTSIDGTTGEATTGEIVGDDFPACDAYSQDPEAGDAGACAAELGCADLEDSVACQAVGFYNPETEVSVECRWGDLLSDAVYIPDELSCDGNITGVCRAAVYLGDGGPPCAGYYRDLGDTLEVLNLECGTPLTGGWEACYVEGGDPIFPACADCFPQLP